jgi:ATP-binding cassette subfamily B protein
VSTNTYADPDLAPHPFEPLSITAEYPAPTAVVDPDRTKSWVWRLFPILYSHRWTILSGLGAALLMVLTSVAIPKTIQLAIDEALINRRTSIEPYAYTLGGLAAFRFVMTFLSRYRLQKTSQLIEFDLRTLMFDHFGRLSFSFFDKVQTGQLISRANSDIRAVERFLTFAPMMAITVIQFVVALVLMIQMHRSLAVLSLIPLPFVYVTGRYMRSKMFPISWVVQARAADVATIVEENVTGVRVVKSFAAEVEQIKTLAKSATRLRWASVFQIDLRAKFAPIMENLPRVGFLIVLLYGGWLVIQGEIKVGVIIAFASYILMLQVPFRMLGFLMLMGQRAAASAGRVLEILDEQPEIQDAPGAIDMINPQGAVEFRDVSFSYGEKTLILNGFNLKLNPGETVAMVGRTGCGKSTAARLIPRFYDVTEGQLLIDGIDVRKYTIRSLRRNVGLVLDEPFLFSESLKDNIAFGDPDAPLEDVERVASIAGADGFVNELPKGYDTIVGERGYTLSGGQRQRTAIARTLLTNPPILILDDATSSVDVQIEQEIHDELRELMKGRTTLIIAHRLSTISLADRVVLVDQGRVVAEGTHMELLRTVPLYAEVLARVEEEWMATHVPAPSDSEDTETTDDEDSPRIAKLPFIEPDDVLPEEDS